MSASESLGHDIAEATFGTSDACGSRCSCDWTTTPWSLPANVAVCRPARASSMSLADRGAEAGCRRYSTCRRAPKIMARHRVVRGSRPRVRPKPFETRLSPPLYERPESPGCPRQSRPVPTAGRAFILHLHTASRTTKWASNTACRFGPVETMAGFTPQPRSSGACTVREADPVVLEAVAVLRARWFYVEPVSAQLSALLAPQDAAPIPGHAAVVHQHGWKTDCASRALARYHELLWRPVWAEDAHPSMVASRPDWCIYGSGHGECRWPSFLQARYGCPSAPRHRTFCGAWPIEVETNQVWKPWFSTDAAYWLGAGSNSYTEVHRHARRVVRLWHGAAGWICAAQD